MIGLGIVVLVIDLLTPFIPLGSCTFLVITIFKPKWFKTLVDKIYGGG